MKKEKIKALVSIVLIAVGVIAIGAYVFPRAADAAVINSLKKFTTVNEESDTIVRENDGFSVDWEGLLKECPDVVGWIRVEGTDISYPVVKTGDDKEEDYYLRRDYTGNYSTSGTIYMQKTANGNFTDFCTVLYGHNMRAGTMFAQLHDFEDEEFFNNHKYIYIYTPYSPRKTYAIYSAHVHSNLMLSGEYNDWATDYDKDVFLNYTKTAEGNHRDLNLSNDCRILTLSTCTDNASQRFLIHAALTKK